MCVCSDNAKIGIFLVSIGFLFLFLGVVLFFDAGLLSIGEDVNDERTVSLCRPHVPSSRLPCSSTGNILFLLGFPFILGWQRTLVFFNPFKRKEKWRGIVLFMSGIVLVLMKRTFIGMIVEVFGMVAMFGGLLPIVVSFLSSLPVIGPLFSSPAVAGVVSTLSGAAARRPPV